MADANSSSCHCPLPVSGGCKAYPGLYLEAALKLWHYTTEKVHAAQSWEIEHRVPSLLWIYRAISGWNTWMQREAGICVQSWVIKDTAHCQFLLNCVSWPISFWALKSPLQLPNLMCNWQIFLRISQVVPPLTLAKAAHKNEEDEWSDPLLISMLKQKCWMLKHTGSVHNLCNNSNQPYEIVLKFVNSKILPIF